MVGQDHTGVYAHAHTCEHARKHTHLSWLRRARAAAMMSGSSSSMAMVFTSLKGSLQQGSGHWQDTPNDPMGTCA